MCSAYEEIPKQDETISRQILVYLCNTMMNKIRSTRSSVNICRSEVGGIHVLFLTALVPLNSRMELFIKLVQLVSVDFEIGGAFERLINV